MISESCYMNADNHFNLSLVHVMFVLHNYGVKQTDEMKSGTGHTQRNLLSVDAAFPMEESQFTCWPMGKIDKSCSQCSAHVWYSWAVQSVKVYTSTTYASNSCYTAMGKRVEEDTLAHP